MGNPKGAIAWVSGKKNFELIPLEFMRDLFAVKNPGIIRG